MFMFSMKNLARKGLIITHSLVRLSEYIPQNILKGFVVYLHFVSFLHIDTTQVVEILPQIRQGPAYTT